MRRFIAYLLASITIFLGIGIAFKPVATSINADLDFRDGREVTFRLANRGDDPEPISDEDKATEYYANVMKQRLEGYGIDNYTITTSGADTIKVTLTTSSATECENISKLLCTNPEIEICNLTKDDITEHPVKDDDDQGKYSWHDSKAYLTYSGASTILVMPIPTDMQKATEEMIEAAGQYEGGDDPDPEKNDDPEPPKQSIVLWMNREAGDEYEFKDKNPNIAKKIIYDQFNTSNFYYGDKKDAFQITFTPAGADIKSITESYNQARLMMNLLNAEETLYACEAIQTEIIPAHVENLLVYGSQVNIAMSATFISMLVAFIVISLILVLFYRLGAIAAISTMAAHTFLTFLIFTLFKPVFNISAMVGLIVIALSALITSIAHNNYLKEELYKGRNLKKANYEASKKTTLLTADISVLTAITGIVLYFLGGASVSSAGIVLVIGSVLNILINTFLLKGMMWLLTNNTSFQDKAKYSLLNVDSKHIPDLSLEEKQTYYGPFINKDYSKKKKISGIVTAVLLAASVVGLIAFNATGKIFNTSNYYASTNEATFSFRADSESQTHPSVEEISNIIKEISFENREMKYGEVTFFTYQMVDDVIEGTKDDPKIYYLQTYKVAINENDVTSAKYSFKGKEGYLNDIINSALGDHGYEAVENQTRVFSNVVYNIPNNVGVVALSTTISLITFMVYLLIRRFRASRVLSVFVTSTVGTVLTIGFISLARVVATPVLSIAMIFTMLATVMMTLFILHKDKDLIKEERMRDLATRKTVLTKANAMALLPMLIFALISVYAAINFFGFGHKEFLALFFSSAFGMVMSVILLVTWFTTMCNFFDEQFARVKLPQIKRRKKNKIKEKSNAPEEAIFIGIND
ncbi:MAG: hypothetical protein MJ214_00105 [Bacilli bacterium]|nr:hypothetical protein [Bacilli bacterium]